MRFELSEEQKLIQQTAREFAERDVRPQAAKIDKTAEWPTDLVKKLGELGLMGVAVPSELGGAGFDNISYAIAMEEIAAVCASTSVIMSVNNSLVCDPLVKYGSDAQHEKFLAPIASGEMLGCFGLTEPASGSDASSMETVAEPDGEHWIINGSKNWITNGPHADVIIVFAAHTRKAGSKGTTAFLIEKDTPGYNPQPRDHKLGIHAAHSCTVFFENCRVPKANQLGDVGMGFKIAMSTLDGGRIGIAAQAIGIGRASLTESIAYAKERKAFGEPIANKQAIQFKLADMAMELDAARLLTQRAAYMKDQGVRHSQQSAMAKLFASEVATRCSHQNIQIHGGYGYSTEYAAERHYRDARITEIYEGTSEIQRIVIAAHALKA